MRMLFFVCVLASLLLMSSISYAEGIDSEGNELPLNAGTVRVATLTSKGAAYPESGVLELEHGIIVKGVGDDADTACSAPGLMRYNTNSGEMQYCNGKTNLWSAAFSSGGQGSFEIGCGQGYSVPGACGGAGCVDNASIVYGDNGAVGCSALSHSWVSGPNSVTSSVNPKLIPFYGAACILGNPQNKNTCGCPSGAQPTLVSSNRVSIVTVTGVFVCEGKN